MSYKWNCVFIVIYLLFFSKPVTSQEIITEDFLRIYVDCQFGCDQTYFKQEMKYVNFMQDRQEADVFLQLIIQFTGGGGREYRLKAQGNDDFTFIQDTIIFYTDADATDNIRRMAILDNIKKAILPAIAKTSLRDKITYEVDMGDEENAISNDDVSDPWNYWVYRVRMRAFFNGQESSKFMNIYNSISANRTTEEHKFFLSVDYSLNRSTFTLSDGEEFTAKNENSSVSLLYVKSLNEKWSAGIRSRVSTSSFGNIEFGGGLRPALEYNVFPYSESSEHQFVFRYSIGPSYVDYEEVTVFDKLEEWLFEHSLDIEYSQIKDWGEVRIDLEYENYLHDWSQLNLSLSPRVEWNLTKGLNLDIWGEVAYISNLRNIQKSEIDNNDILLQNRQLDTNFEYFGGIGLSYRFGSAFNNIVNPRF